MIAKFKQRFLLDRLSSEFKAYLPGYIIGPHTEFTPHSSPPAVFLTDGQRAIHFARWGYFTKGYEFDLHAKMLRPSYPFARIEEIQNSRLYAKAFQRRRYCLVPATAFTHGKPPVTVMLSGHDIFAFAGLWTETERGSQPDEISFTMLTTAAHAQLKTGPRMPLCLTKEAYLDWLLGKFPLSKAIKFNQGHSLSVQPE